LWWPLFDGISARELRAEHQRERVVERYRASVASGTSPDCGPDYAPARFRDSGVNPELVPLWHQLYYGFVAPSVTTVDFALTVSLPNRELRGAGLSEAGIDAIASMASETRSEIDRRRAEAFEATNPLPDAGELFAVASDARVGVLDVEAQRIESYRIHGEATDGRGDPRPIARFSAAASRTGRDGSG